MLRTLLALLTGALPAYAQDTTALTHVAVVDLQSGMVAREQTILLANGRIARIGPVAETQIPPSARVMSYPGRFVIPGLWDMHAHLSDSRTSLALCLANGVTGVRDMGSSRAARPWIDSARAGLIQAPRLLIAGPIVERAEWLTAVKKIVVRIGSFAMLRELAERIPVGDAASARAAVDTVIASGADFLKVRNDPGREATFALLRAARERGLPVAGHWPVSITAEEASDSGYRSVEHGPFGVSSGALGTPIERSSAAERAHLIATLIRNRTGYTPTLVASASNQFNQLTDSAVARLLADTAGVREPRMRYVPNALRESWIATLALESASAQIDWASLQRQWNRELRPMADAGVLILTGTDTGVPFVFPCFAVADEMALLVRDGGLTVLESLRAATSNVAAWMRAEDDFGSVEQGKRADLVLLDANPLDDIGNVRRITAVVRAGKVLDRAALDALLRSAIRGGARP